MLHNSNGGVIARLSKRSLKAGRRRNVPVVLTIMIAAALMAGVALLILGNQTANRRAIEGTHQGYASGLDEAQAAALYADEALERVGKNTVLDSLQNEQYTLNPRVMDEDLMKLSKMTLEGRLPEKADEVALDREFAGRYFAGAGLGDTVLLDVGQGEEALTVAGLFGRDKLAFDDNLESNEKTTFSALLSPTFLEGLDHVPVPAYYFHFAGSGEWAEQDLVEAVAGLQARLGLDPTQISTSTRYLTLMRPLGTNFVLLMAGLGLLLALAATLVIYSIFYISVTSSVRDYGRLRTLGATKKQVGALVRRQGLVLAALGIFAGLALSCILAAVAVPAGFSVPNTLVVCGVVAALTLAVVLLAVRKPAKMAASVSPVEATRYSPAAETPRRKARPGPRKVLSPLRLAGLQARRNRRKTLFTLLSLSLSGILFACAASYFSSISIEKMVRGDSRPYGEFFLSLRAKDADEGDDHALGKLQEKNPMPELLRSIEAMEGVEGVQAESHGIIFFTPPGYGMRSSMEISGFGRYDAELFLRRITEGGFDYDDYVENDKVLVTISDTMEEIYGWKPQVGEVLALEFWTADGPVTHEFTVGALAPGRIKEGGLLIPDEVFSRITGYDNTAEAAVKVDPAHKEAVGAALWTIAGNDAQYFLTTLDDLMASQKDTMNMMMGMVYALVAILVLFGGMNLANTIVTNVLARKQELSMMQAVGMTGGQLGAMMRWEGLLYVGTVAVATFTLGSVAGWGLCNFVDGLGGMFYLDYRFPGLLMAAFVGLLLVLQLAITAYSLMVYRKQPLVERMKEMET